MAKSLAKKLVSAKYFIDCNGRVTLTEEQISELTRFDVEIGFTYDRGRTIAYWFQIGVTDWTSRWRLMSILPNATLEYQKLYHGDTKGLELYLVTNAKKTAHFNHSPEIQKERAQRSANLVRGTDNHSVRSYKYWMKKGLTEEQAKAKVREIQATNSKARYITKYGIVDGTRRFDERKNNWQVLMSTPTIGRNRSLGLWRYIERYGESEGRRKYTEMRLKRNLSCRMGKASNESVSVFSDILLMLDSIGSEYYIGLPGKHEWFIYDHTTTRPYFYDLTIPTLSIIIEYHGEAFHPNPKWPSEKWNEWKSAFSNKSANEQRAVDEYKRSLAESKGWTVYEIYSSSPEFANDVLNKLYFLANSNNSSGI